MLSNNVRSPNFRSSDSKKSISTVVWIYFFAFILMTWSFQLFAAEAKKATKEVKNPTVVITTSLGQIKIKLDAKNAPISTENFLKYVGKKFYDKTIFHRVIDGFMIQGGGFTADMTEKPTLFPAINNEAKNGLSNKRGTIAMARTQDVNSATAQFYINVVDNAMLDHKGEDQFGYAVFGEITEGMDVIDKIKLVKTGNKGPHQNVPEKPIVIESIRKGK